VRNPGERREARGKSKKFFLPVLLPVAYCLLPVFLAFSQEYYRWVDDRGAVHFTDNIYSIPEKFRAQAEKRLPPASGQPAPLLPERRSGPSEPRQFVVPFTRTEGNHILVDGIVNGRSKVKFILDTGAFGSTIPRSMAAQSGIDLDKGLLITTGGVGGAVEVPLVEIDSINVGGAEVKNLEITIQDLPFGAIGPVGLLGADFLLEYRVEIQYAQNQVVLEPQEGPYGGHSSEWWQQRFRRYAGFKKTLDLTRARSESQPARDALDRQLRILEDKINNLETRASQAGIPREFRQ
jgi:predicted aspartyl protease